MLRPVNVHGTIRDGRLFFQAPTLPTSIKELVVHGQQIVGSRLRQRRQLG